MSSVAGGVAHSWAGVAQVCPSAGQPGGVVNDTVVALAAPPSGTVAARRATETD